jgi:glycosyltransferase involved in cell wall biosynthesis
VVATDVGGVRDAVGEAALLIGPADASAAVAAVQRVADEPEFRAQLIAAGLASAARHTLQAESARVVQFIERPSAGGPIRRPPG